MPSFKSTFLVAVVALVPLASAGSGSLDETRYPFQQPVATDSRSPCPGLNALANHGLLPRNGKDIDLANLVQGAYLGFSLAEAATLLVGSVGLKASTTLTPNITFNLKDLNHHEIIEHDGSMTRDDIYFGNSLDFSQEAYERTLANWGDTEIISVGNIMWTTVWRKQLTLL